MNDNSKSEDEEESDQNNISGLPKQALIDSRLNEFSWLIVYLPISMITKYFDLYKYFTIENLLVYIIIKNMNISISLIFFRSI